MIRLCVGEYECRINSYESGVRLSDSIHIALHILIVTTVHQLIIIIIFL